MFVKFRKRRALKAYISKLPGLLQKDYGGIGPYTVGQVTRTVERYGLNQNHVAYACAIFVEKERFMVAYQNESDFAYENLKQEVADKFFFGNANFSMVGSGYAAFDSGSGFDSD